MYYIVYRIYDTILPYSYARQETHHTLKKKKSAGSTMRSWPQRWTLPDGPSAHHVCTNGALGVGVAGLLGSSLRRFDRKTQSGTAATAQCFKWSRCRNGLDTRHT